MKVPPRPIIILYMRLPRLTRILFLLIPEREMPMVAISADFETFG